MKRRPAPKFFSEYHYERKMVADAVRLGAMFPNIWMSFQLDVTGLVEVHQQKKLKQESPGLPAYFVLATARILSEHRGFIGHISGEKIKLPANVRMRITSRNVLGRMVSHILTNPQELEVSSIKATLNWLLATEDELILPRQKRFFSLPWWLRKVFYKFWLRSAEKRDLIFGNCYFACNGFSSLSGSFTTHTSSLWGVHLYYSDVYNKDERYFVTLSVSADHRMLDAYHLTFLAECLEIEFHKIAQES